MAARLIRVYNSCNYMNRKFETAIASLCIAASLGAALFVAYSLLSQNASGRDAAKADFEGLRSVLAYVKDPADLSDPGLRARLASRYEASPNLLLVEVYERGSGDRWRIPDESPYLDEAGRGESAPKHEYPPASTMLLSAPLKGDSSGKLAVDALYVSLPQAAVFAPFRDALIGLGAFIAAAALALAIGTGRKSEGGGEAAFDFSPGTEPGTAKGAGEAQPKAAGEASDAAEEESFADQWNVEDTAAAAAHYQFETLAGESPEPEGQEEFEIPDMESDFAPEPKELSLEDWPETEEAGAQAPAASRDGAQSSGRVEGSLSSAAGEKPGAARELDGLADAAAVGAGERTMAATAGEGRPDGSEKPRGLFSPSSGLGWETYLEDRLDAELSRSASFEQDLSLLVLCYDDLGPDDPAYARIGSAIKDFFSFRDLAFEKNGDGFSVILPNVDSSHAIRMAEEFFKKLSFLAEGDFAELELMPIYMGISSRAGRLVDAKRLVEEASAALDRARYEKDTHIVGFRPDPDKYRQFLTSKAAC